MVDCMEQGDAQGCGLRASHSQPCRLPDARTQPHYLQNAVLSVVACCQVLGAEQIVDSLDGRENTLGNLHEKRDPMGHCPVPETWQFHGLYVSAFDRLSGYESGLRVNKIRQIEFIMFVIAQAAYQVDRVEKFGGVEDFFLLGIVHVYLR